MFNWLKEKLVGNELRKKDETIQHYREMLKVYEVNYEEYSRAKLKAEILEMHLEQGSSLDDAIKKAVDSKITGYQSALYRQMAAQQNINMYGQDGIAGLSSLTGIFGSKFFQ